MAKDEAKDEAKNVAKKFWPHLALCLLTSLFAPPGDLPEAAIPHTTSPRISDTLPPKARQSVDPAPTLPGKFPEVATDITASSIDFDHRSLNRLVEVGQVTLDHPEGGDLVLSLVSTARHGAITTLAVSSDGYSGTITAKGDSFFATLATNRGVYAIEHRHGLSLLVDQRQLDLRITQPDFRHVPTV